MAEEKNLENKIKTYLKSKGVWYIKIWGSMFTRSGIPDILCCINGKFVAIEVKSSIGKMSKLQEYEVEKVQKSKGLFYCVRPQNFNEFKKEVENLL